MRFGAVVLAVAGCRAPAAPVSPGPAVAPARLTDRGAASNDTLRLRIEARAPETGDAVQLLGGGSIVCARRHEADLACFGRVGLFDPELSEHAGAPATEDEPVVLTGFRHGIALHGGADGRCLLEANGTASCWGDPFAWSAAFEPLAPQPWPGAGRVESLSVTKGAYAVVDGTAVVRGDPVCPGEALAELRELTRVAAAEEAACVLHRNGTLSCWDRECSGPPAPVDGVERVVQVAAGAQEVCARTIDGRVWCFGGRRFIEVSRSVHIAAAGQTACSLRDDGVVHCWSAASRPERVTGLGAAIDLVVAADRACALGVDRELVCIGSTPGPRISADAWRRARALWPGRTREQVVRDGALQGFRAAANEALGELQYNLDRYCDAHDCSRRWPPAMGPTAADADDALRGWPDLSPTDDPVDAFAGAEVTAAPEGRTYVFTVSYRGTVFDHDVTLATTCHVRPQPAPERASFRRITCDAPILGP